MSINQIELIPIENLIVSPFNVRKNVGDITDLKQSIKSIGLLQPIIVREMEGRLEVVVGQRRLLACKALNLDTIPAIKRKMTDQESLILSLTENVQIDTLDPIQRAEGVKRIVDHFAKEKSRSIAIEEVAKLVGKSPVTIYEWLRLFETSEGVKAMIREKKIDTKVGARLASLPKEAQVEIAKVIHGEYIPQSSAVKVIEQVKDKLKEKSELQIKDIVKETIVEVEEYSVSVSFTGSLYKDLSKFAREKKITIQETIRRAVKKYLNL